MCACAVYTNRGYYPRASVNVLTASNCAAYCLGGDVYSKKYVNHFYRRLLYTSRIILIDKTDSITCCYGGDSQHLDKYRKPVAIYGNGYWVAIWWCYSRSKVQLLCKSTS